MGGEKKRISSVYFEDEMWHFDEPEQEVTCRSRSHDNSSEFAPSYSSHTIKDVVSQALPSSGTKISWWPS